MKNYHFRLENILKLREFEEYKEKIELGKINSKMKDIDYKIDELSNDIDTSFKLMKETLKGSKLINHELSLYNFWNESYREHIVYLKKERLKIEKEYNKKLEEVLKAKNRVKVLKKLKDKSLSKYKKDFIKFEANEIDDLIIQNKEFNKDMES